MKVIKAELILNGKKAVVGHQFLEDTVRDIPDIKENRPIFAMLAASDNPEVREMVSRNDNLGKKTIHLLLSDENQEVVENVLSNSSLSKHIKEEVLLRIVKSGNIKYLKAIASNLDDYALCDTCKLAAILSKHENVSVRYALVDFGSSDAVTTKTLKKLSKDRDTDIAKKAKWALRRR